MHRKRPLTSALVTLLLFFFFLLEPSFAFRKQISAMTKSESSSVLRELKDTIQKQKSEIASLQKQLQQQQGAAAAAPGKQQPAVAAVAHGAHGAGPEESPDELRAYLSRPAYRIAAKRVGWLSLFLVSLSFTALIMNGFEHTLEKHIELAYFVPLLAGHGGNTGGQAVGTVLSTLSAGVVKMKDAPKVIAKEAMSGLMAGIILGLGVGSVANYIMGISFHVSMVVGCTIPLVSTIAGTLGSAIPFFCVLMGQDPSVIAAPAMTSFVDVSGLMAYFLIANKIFAIYGIEL